MSQKLGLYARWALEVRRAGFFQAGERVGVAVSGGPDSMLLLDFMIRLAGSAGLKPVAVHFNHRLRGAESEGDERFVREQAEKAGVDFLRGEANVARVAREKRKNLEATARALRYRFFSSLINRGQLDKVATAHTANDQAETVLLRLLRGSGTRGLGGIHPILDGRVIRPFLTLTRAEVEAELASRQLPFRTDASNQDVRFARNRVRQRLLPLLETEFNPSIVRSLADFADRARDDEAFLEEQARERSQAWLTRESDALKIPARSLEGFPPAIARRVLRRMLADAGARPGSITSGLLESLRHLARDGQSGRRIVIGADLEARKEFEWLVVGSPSGAAEAPDFAYPVIPPAEIAIPQLDLLLRFRLSDISGADPPEGGYTKRERVGLDFGRLAEPLTLRNWRPGDRMEASGGKESLKVKELFQLRRIPVGSRRCWPVLESGGAVVWVRGFPPATAVRISGASAQRLVIEESSLVSKGD